MEEVMKLELINSSGCSLDIIDDEDKETALERAVASWGENLTEGDTIRVLKVYDEE
jgi:hypothetical protein